MLSGQFGAVLTLSDLHSGLSSEVDPPDPPGTLLGPAWLGNGPCVPWPHRILPLGDPCKPGNRGVPR